MSFYLWAMRSAAAILFVYALVTFLVSVVTVLGMGAGPIQPGFQMILAGLTAAFGSAMVPFFGAALLWRLDRWLPGAGESAA